MADAKKYYYMRLKEDYFDDDAQKILESMPDGYLYSNILLKLYLKSLKRDGLLMYNERIPFNAQMIATITNHQIGTVEKALVLFRDMGFIEVLDSGAIFMLDVQHYVGKTTTEADRKRAYRARIEEARANVPMLPDKCPDKCTPEIRDKRLKNRDKRLENRDERIKDKEDMQSSAPAPDKPTRHKYGEYKNVLLSDEDMEKLKSEFPHDWEQRIERLSEYIASKGAKYKNHLATIRAWARKEVKPDAKHVGRNSPDYGSVESGVGWNKIL